MKLGVNAFLGFVCLGLLIFFLSNVRNEVINEVFACTRLCMAISFVVSYISPLQFVAINPMPFTARIENNFGTYGLESNSILYSVFHQTVFNQITHTTFIFDQLCWFIFVSANFGTFGQSVLLAFVVLQAFSFNDLSFGCFATLIWAFIAMLTNAATMIFTQEILLHFAAVVLIANGTWRSIGHLFEDVPPLVLNNNTTFISMRKIFSEMNPLQIVGLTVCGYTSEMIAGLPFRLINVQMYWAFRSMMKRRNIQYQGPVEKEIETKMTRECLAKGWKGYAVTREWFQDILNTQ